MLKVGFLGWIRFTRWRSGPAELRLCRHLRRSWGGISRHDRRRYAKKSQGRSSLLEHQPDGHHHGRYGIGLCEPASWSTTLAAVLIYATHHASAKGALFLSVGPAQAARGRLEVAWVRVGMIIPALTLAGAPFTSGAIAKTALKSNLEFLPETWALWIGVLLPLAALGTVLKMIRFLWLLWPSTSASVGVLDAGLWRPWAFTAAMVLMAVWFLPVSLLWLPVKFSLDNVWAAILATDGGGRSRLHRRADPAARRLARNS
jgi:hypothetical protein